jgi:hypothetical protein
VEREAVEGAEMITEIKYALDIYTAMAIKDEFAAKYPDIEYGDNMIRISNGFLIGNGKFNVAIPTLTDNDRAVMRKHIMAKADAKQT